MKRHFLILLFATLFFTCKKEEEPSCDTTDLSFNNALNYRVTIAIPGIGEKEITPLYGVSFDVEPNKTYSFTVYRTSDRTKLFDSSARSNGCGKYAIYDIKNN